MLGAHFSTSAMILDVIASTFDICVDQRGSRNGFARYHTPDPSERTHARPSIVNFIFLHLVTYHATHLYWEKFNSFVLLYSSNLILFKSISFCAAVYNNGNICNKFPPPKILVTQNCLHDSRQNMSRSRRLVKICHMPLCHFPITFSLHPSWEKDFPSN